MKTNFILIMLASLALLLAGCGDDEAVRAGWQAANEEKETLWNERVKWIEERKKLKADLHEATNAWAVKEASLIGAHAQLKRAQADSDRLAEKNLQLRYGALWFQPEGLSGPEAIQEFHRLQAALNAATNGPTFQDGVKYGVLFHAREFWVEDVAKVTEGASNLWRVTEIEKGSNTLSAAFRAVYPERSFDEGIEYGANVLFYGLRSGATNLSMEAVKNGAYEAYARQKFKKELTNSGTNQAGLGTNGVQTPAGRASPAPNGGASGETNVVKGKL